MEQFLSEHKYLHVVVLCVGLLLQALFPTHFIIDIIGYILIFISPMKLYTEYMERIYEDPCDKNEGRWLPCPEDKLTELLSYISPSSYTTQGRATSNKSSIAGYIIVIIVTVIIGYFISQTVFDLSDIEYGHVFFFDLPMLIFALSCFSGPTVASHPLSIQAGALSVFQTMELPDTFYKRFEARLVKDVNGDPDILDVRLQIRPRESFDPLLCMMATISRTKVQERIYPYAYFVLVFRGNMMASYSSEFSSEMIDMVNSSNFATEAKVQNGDSVIVVLPRRKSQYTTTNYDCCELRNLMIKTCRLLDKHKDEIIQLCK